MSLDLDNETETVKQCIVHALDLMNGIFVGGHISQTEAMLACWLYMLEFFARENYTFDQIEEWFKIELARAAPIESRVRKPDCGRGGSWPIPRHGRDADRRLVDPEGRGRTLTIIS